MNIDQDRVTVTLNINEEKILFETLKIKYVSCGHEHVSSSPDEPFSATVGVYVFEVTDGTVTTTITIYKDAYNSSQEIEWLRYKLILLHTTDEEMVTVAITRV